MPLERILVVLLTGNEEVGRGIFHVVICQFFETEGKGKVGVFPLPCQPLSLLSSASDEPVVVVNSGGPRRCGEKTWVSCLKGRRTNRHLLNR